MKYLSIAQTAERWGISTRRIQILCGEGRVPGAIRIGTVWGIPEDAEKPADARIKNGKYSSRASARRSSAAFCTHNYQYIKTRDGFRAIPRFCMYQSFSLLR